MGPSLFFAGANSCAAVEGRNQSPSVWRGLCTVSGLAIRLLHLKFSVDNRRNKRFFGLRNRNAANQVVRSARQ